MHAVRYWADLVSQRMPRNAWVLAETGSYIELDELCVELESVTGESATALRGELLLHATGDLLEDASGADLAGDLGFHDPRLALWALCCLAEARYEPVIDRISQDLVNGMSTLADVARGQKRRARAVGAGNLRPSPNSTYGYERTFNAFLGNASLLVITGRSSISDRDSALTAGTFIEIGTYNNGPKASVLIADAIMRFPVAEKPWSKL